MQGESTDSRKPVACAAQSPGTMLRVRMLSGEEVDRLPVGELSDVKELKLRLHQLHGLPTRFRLRLLRDGKCMDDSVMLDSPMDLDLVLLAYSAASQEQHSSLWAAADSGSATEVRTS